MWYIYIVFLGTRSKLLAVILNKGQKTTCLPRRRGTRYGDPTYLNHINWATSLQKNNLAFIFSCAQMACKQTLVISRGNMTRKQSRKLAGMSGVCWRRITAPSEHGRLLSRKCRKVLLRYSNPTRVWSIHVSYYSFLATILVDFIMVYHLYSFVVFWLFSVFWDSAQSSVQSDSTILLCLHFLFCHCFISIPLHHFIFLRLLQLHKSFKLCNQTFFKIREWWMKARPSTFQ